MELLSNLPVFFTAVLLLALVPGPAVALLIRRCSLGGFSAGAPVVIGLEAGLYLWALAAGAGLAALVATSQTAYAVLRVIGAAVLVVLGVQALLAARRSDPPAVTPLPLIPRGSAGGFSVGLVTNLANPKVAVFMFAFYPQFIPPGYPVLLTAAALGLVQVGVEAALYFGFCAAIGRARAWFSRQRVRRSLDALCGAVLVGLGLRLATDG